ncbi:hypothetical protein M0802_007349 [Mischocyttarus mexicanus]|nr:hypothetical protein M0802_007349 [Mischocyttarus mexicanus]
MANNNNGQCYGEQWYNGQCNYNGQLYHGTMMQNLNFTNTSNDSAQINQSQNPACELNELSIIDSVKVDEINIADLIVLRSLHVTDSSMPCNSGSTSTSRYNEIIKYPNLPSSTNVSPLSCFQTSPNSNNYYGNSYCEMQRPSTNITVNEYSNSEVHSQVIYPQCGYEPYSKEEYNRCNQLVPRTIPSTEECSNHGPMYLQDVTCKNQIDLACENPIYSRNRKMSIHNYSLNCQRGMDNTEVGVKRTRQVYTKHQTKILEDEFKNNHYINKAKRAELSELLSLSEKKIKIWFQNRRTKTKKLLTLQ